MPNAPVIMTKIKILSRIIARLIYNIFRLMICLQIALVLFLLLVGTYKLIISWTMMDLSQEYTSIDNYEGIILKDYDTNTAYKRSFWGLTKTDEPVDFSYHGENLNSNARKTLERLAPGNAGHIGQCTISPDGRKILYMKANPSDEADPTDIVDCSYNVLNLDDGTVKEFFRNPRAGLGVEWH